MTLLHDTIEPVKECMKNKIGIFSNEKEKEVTEHFPSLFKYMTLILRKKTKKWQIYEKEMLSS